MYSFADTRVDCDLVSVYSLADSTDSEIASLFAVAASSVAALVALSSAWVAKLAAVSLACCIA